MVSSLLKHKRQIRPHKHHRYIISTLSPSPTLAMVKCNRPKNEAVVIAPKMATYKVCVVQTQSSSKNLFKLKNLNHSQLKLIVTNPHLINSDFANLVQTTPDGVMKPYNIPDLSDLALCPKVLRITYEWVIKTSDSTNIYSNLAALSKFCIPCLPTFKEVFSMCEGTHHLEVQSFSSLLKFITFNHVNTTRITLRCITEQIKTDWRDGRRTSMHFEKFKDAAKPQNVSSARQLVPREATITIWNCRGIGSCGFLSAYDDITQNHEADVVILLEVRTPTFLCKSILQHTDYCSLSVKDPIGLCGGVAIITLNRLVKVHMSLASENSTNVKMVVA